MPLTRCEFKEKRPLATIEHGGWVTRHVAPCDSIENAALITKMLDANPLLKSVSSGIYRVPHETVLEAYLQIVGAKKPIDPRFFGIWFLIAALFIYSVSMRVFGVFFWFVLMVFLKGGKSTNIVATTIWFRLANVDKSLSALGEAARKY